MAVTHALVAVGICLAAGVLEGAFAGSGVRQRLAELTLPARSPSLPVWIGIGILYYLVSGTVIFRLLAGGLGPPLPTLAFGLLMTVLFVNAWWNHVFFRKRDLRRSVRVTVGYSALAFVVLGLLLVVDRVAAAVWATYVGYLVYAIWWTAAVARLNSEPV